MSEALLELKEEMIEMYEIRRKLGQALKSALEKGLAKEAEEKDVEEACMGS